MGAGLDLYGLRKDGCEFPVEISLSPLDAAGGQLYCAAVRDVSDRREADGFTDDVTLLLVRLPDALLPVALDRDQLGQAVHLVPYALWCVFATVLNAVIARRNR